MPETKPIRWWPAVVLLVLAVMLLVWIQLGDSSGQERAMNSIAVVLLLAVLLLVWALVFSRLPWRRRVVIGLVAAGVVVGLVKTVEIRGVTGDVVPILAWRWSERPAEPLAAPTIVELAPEPIAAEAPEPRAVLPSDQAPVAEVAATGATPDLPGAAAAASEGTREIDVAPAHGGFPGFLGLRRDGTVTGVKLARNWASYPPRELWRQPIGAGWSGFAIDGELAITQEQRGELEVVSAYELETGTLRWQHAGPGRYETVIAGIGPRATPAVADGRVFAQGAVGRLTALDRNTGRELWSRDLVAEHGGVTPEWGRSTSPLVLGGLVVASAGGPDGHSLVAYRGDTGELAWRAGDDPSSYSSPLRAEIGGAEQVVILNANSVAGHDPSDGRQLWRMPWPSEQPSVAVPVVLPDGRLFVSAGYGVGGKLLELGSSEAPGPRWVWETPRLKAKFTNVVFHDGYLYGLDDGTLVCLDPSSGERCWKQGRYGHGQVLLVGDLLLLQSEKGEIVLIEPNPKELRELGRFQALQGKTWNPPALAGDRLLVRHDREVVCYQLPLEL